MLTGLLYDSSCSLRIRLSFLFCKVRRLRTYDGIIYYKQRGDGAFLIVKWIQKCQ